MSKLNTRELAIKKRQTELADQFEPWRTDGSWHEDAFCRGIETARYFPEKVKYNDSTVKDIVRRDCLRCPVRKECLVDALATRGTSGIHGGILFPGALLKFDATSFENTLVWSTYAKNIEATARLERRRELLG